MPFFPFSTEPVTISMWKHAAAEGRYGDAAAYYSSLGGVWDLFWLDRRAGLRPQTLRPRLLPQGDRARRPAGVGVAAPHACASPSERLLLLYRGFFFYGLGRMLVVVPLRPLRRQDAVPAGLGRAPTTCPATTSPTPGAGGGRPDGDRRRALRRLPVALLAAVHPTSVGARRRPADGHPGHWYRRGLRTASSRRAAGRAAAPPPNRRRSPTSAAPGNVPPR